MVEKACDMINISVTRAVDINKYASYGNFLNKSLMKLTGISHINSVLHRLYMIMTHSHGHSWPRPTQPAAMRDALAQWRFVKPSLNMFSHVNPSMQPLGLSCAKSTAFSVSLVGTVTGRAVGFLVSRQVAGAYLQ